MKRATRLIARGPVCDGTRFVHPASVERGIDILPTLILALRILALCGRPGFRHRNGLFRGEILRWMT
ncbi:MAG: hypothetical protein J2P48_02355 [Alphaproteobacteria bacterium]|nr:hypothetical protein [Alphaproteobacteria bacterium]